MSFFRAETSVWIRRSLIVLMVLSMVLVFRSAWDREAVVVWLQQANPFTFFAIATGLIMIGIPLTPLFIVAGTSFGIRVGLLGSLLALACSLTLTYRIAQSGLRPRLDRLLRRFGYDLPNLSREGSNAVRFTLMVKFAPGVPGFIKNYGLAIARVPFSIYFVSSMLITGAYATLLIVVGESLVQHDVSKVVWALIILLVGAPVAYFWVRRARGRDAGAALAGSEPH